MGRVFNVMGNQDIYNEDLDGNEADKKAIYSDWAAVGDHIVSAAEELDPDVCRKK